jgi:hypothetical protein
MKIKYIKDEILCQILEKQTYVNLFNIGSAGVSQNGTHNF